MFVGNLPHVMETYHKNFKIFGLPNNFSEIETVAKFYAKIGQSTSKTRTIHNTPPNFMKTFN